MLPVPFPSIDRLELCALRETGGLTPSLADFLGVKEAAREKGVPVHVMVRPEADDTFCSRPGVSDMDGFKEAGADGFVFGVLNGRWTF